MDCTFSIIIHCCDETTQVCLQAMEKFIHETDILPSQQKLDICFQNIQGLLSKMKYHGQSTKKSRQLLILTEIHDTTHDVHMPTFPHVETRMFKCSILRSYCNLYQRRRSDSARIHQCSTCKHLAFEVLDEPHASLLITSVYGPPSQKLNRFKAVLTKLTQFAEDYPIAMFVGDFNEDLKKSGHWAIYELMEQHGTRVTTK